MSQEEKSINILEEKWDFTQVGLWEIELKSKVVGLPAYSKIFIEKNPPSYFSHPKKERIFQDVILNNRKTDIYYSTENKELYLYVKE